VTAAGVRPGDALAVVVERDLTAPALLLGAHSAGAAWMPLEPGAVTGPVKVRAVLAGRRAVVPAELAHLPVVDVEEAGPPEGQPVVDPGTCLVPTTGAVPVVLSDAALGSAVDGFANAFGLGPADRFAALPAATAEAGLLFALIPLALGAALVLPPEGSTGDPVGLAARLRQEGVTVLHLGLDLVERLAGAATDLAGLRVVSLPSRLSTRADVARAQRLAPAARVAELVAPAGSAMPLAFRTPAGDAVACGDGELLVLDLDGRPAAVGELGEVVVRTSGATWRTGERGRHLTDGAVRLADRLDLRAAGGAPDLAAPTAAGRPWTDTELVVAGIWAEVLGRPVAASTDNFFDIGGDSMMSVTVHGRLAALFGSDLRLVHLFQHPSVRSLAAHLDGTGGSGRVERAARRAEERREARAARASQARRLPRRRSE
jgi:non-ribosomal peptide synthetase component F